MTHKGRVALVTGASRGIGRAIALRLAAGGAAVAVNYVRSAAEAESLAASIRAAGGRAMAASADVASEAEVNAMAGRIASEWGPIDILVNNAGISFHSDLDSYDPEKVARMRRVNFDGVIHTIRAAAGGMRERGFGRIVNVTSIAALGTTMKGTSFYAADKAGVTLLTRRFAMDLGPFGITVNAVAPGFIRTDMTQSGRTPEEAEASNRTVARLAMVGRVGQPEDIAHAVAFLASDEAGFITAQTLVVDGGRMDYIAHP